MAADKGGQRRRTKPGSSDQEQIQEQEQEQVVEQEAEKQRDATQDQMGNQGVADMLGVATQTKPGSAGLAIEDERRHDTELDLQFGGDDDAPVDGPLTLDDITRSWNQGTRRGKDRTTFEEPMPSEDLPPEDTDFVRAVKADRRRPELPVARTFDPMVQPSAGTVAGDIQRWVAEAARWSGTGLAHRTLAHLVTPAAPCLQDPHGRVLLSRTRVAALATVLVLDGPALSEGPSVLTSGFVNLCLELAGRHHKVLEVFHAVQASEVRLPVARTVLDARLAKRRPAQVRPVQLGRRAETHLQLVLDGLMDLPSATTLLPALPDAEGPADEDEADDPLGLDAVLASFTGGPIDADAGLYDAALQAAERLAAQCARLRVRLVGVSMAVADAADLWSSGAPTRNLQWVADQIDREVDRVLQLLVEVARAAQHRRVAPRGVRNGLRRVARMLDKTQATALTLLAAVIGGVLPGEPDVPDHFLPDADDPLHAAWADGRPHDALKWLITRPEGLDRDAAMVFTRAGAGDAPGDLVEPLERVRERATRESRPLLAIAAGVLEGACALWLAQPERSLERAAELIASGTARRNGLWVATGGLLAMEAHHLTGDREALEAARYDTAHVVWHMGNRAAFTLLARWTPPDEVHPAVAAR